jgi:flagellar biosynthesis protein FlhF
MNVKRYIASDINEAMIKIKNELGRDAIILNTRKIKKPGIFGFFRKPLLEVVAAIDKKENPSRDLNNEEIISLRDEFRKVVKNNENEKIDSTVKNASVNQEISDLRDIVNDLAKKISDVREKDEIFEEDRIKKLLHEKNLTEEAIEKIKNILSGRINVEESTDKALLNAIRLIIKEILEEPYVVDEFTEGKKVIIFVGPTGVGKTTTLAKLAARLSLISNKKVALITADTYRIAAVDQLKTYSEILGLPLKVIYEPEEIKDAVDSYSKKDCILIDTAGRSHKSEELFRDLKGILSYVEDPEIFLVISLTTGYKDIKSIIDSYSFLKDYKLLFTKLDESSSWENVVNVKLHTGRSLSYFTIGQSVPDDIEIADTEKIANYIVGE